LIRFLIFIQKRVSCCILRFFCPTEAELSRPEGVTRLDTAVIVLKTTLPKLRAAHVFCPGTKIQGQNNRSAPCRPIRVLKVCFATTIPECVVLPATTSDVRDSLLLTHNHFLDFVSRLAFRNAIIIPDSPSPPVCSMCSMSRRPATLWTPATL